MCYLPWNERLVMHKDESYFLIVCDDDNDNGESGDDGDMIMKTSHSNHPSRKRINVIR